MTTGQIIVDIDEFTKWVEGVLLEFHNGRGFAVNEVECQAAEEALERGEEVLCRRGAFLTGTRLIKRGNGIMEV